MINIRDIPKVLTLICFLLSVQRTYEIQFKASPCPSVFSYEKAEEDDRWYGVINVRINKTVEGASFRVALDRPSELLAILKIVRVRTEATDDSEDSWTGPATTTNNKVYTGYYEDAKLLQGTTYTARIMVKFDKNKATPMLETVHLNGARICPPDPAIALSNGDGSGSASRPDLANTPPPRPDPPSVSHPPDLNIDNGGGGVVNSGNSQNGGFNQGGSGGFNTDNGYGGGNSNSAGTVIRTTSRPTASGTGVNSGGSNNVATGTNSGNWPSTTNTGGGQNTGGSSGSSGNWNNGGTSNPNPNSYNPGNTNSNSVKPTGSSSGGNKGQAGSVVPCGTVSKVNPLIVSGQNTQRGQWPWHIALYKTEGINLSYLCGGSLISKNKIITAAHCVVTSPGNRVINFETLVIYLGKHNLRQYTGETGVQTKEVSEIKINPNYNSSNFAGDIAILTLRSDVEFTEYVRPVCTWEATNGIDDIVGQEGVVAGWGLTEAEQTSEELKMATLPVVSTETCFRSHPKFYSEYLSDTAFCAGFRNGTSPCNGDSGGGLVFKRNSNTWYLRGIVSLSVAKEGLNFCDPKFYVIFTDTARYVDFIRKNVS